MNNSLLSSAPTSAPALPRWPTFGTRSTLAELMDDLTADPAVTRQSLRELEVINRFLGGFSLTLDALAGLHPTGTAEQPWILVDVGCGSGDMLRVIARWARRRHLPCRLIGLDWNAVMIATARDSSTAYPEIEFVQADVWSPSLAALSPDVVHSSLFTHHFDAPVLPRLLRQFAEAAKRAVVINDLHRHPLAYYSIILLTQLFSRSMQVKYDGPVSVLRAMRATDWQAALSAAQLNRFDLHWRWAFRWQLVIDTRP